MRQIEITSSLIDFFKGNPMTLIFAGYCQSLPNVKVYNDGDSYALVADTGRFLECCIFTEDIYFADEFVGSFHNCYAEFRMITPKIVSHLAKRYHFGYHVSCGLFVWNGKPLPYKCSNDLRPMPVEYAHLVAKGTSYASDEDVIELLNLHPSSALFVDGKPVCWCLLHLEKSLGMLYTLPEHRNKGYALEVMTDLTNKVIAQGDIPYATIIKGNVASERLAEKYNINYFCDADYISIKFDS